MKVVTLNEVLASTTPIIFALRVAEEGEWDATSGLGDLMIYTGEHSVTGGWFSALPLSGDLYWLAGDNDKVNAFIEGGCEGDLPLSPKATTMSISGWSACSFIVFSVEDVKTFIGNLARTFQAITKLQVVLNDEH